MAYSWKPIEALSLLGIPVNPNKTEVYLTCPKCGGKRFSFNLVKGIGKCWQCSFTADSASYYAISTGFTLKEARLDIERRLGIQKNGERTIPPRIVYNTQHQEAPKAPDEVLDDTYRAFLSELHLSDKNKNMLMARGLSEDEIEELNYKTLPRRDEIDFFALCRRLQTNGHVLKGVPGFFKTKTGDYTFVQLTKGIIMPLVNRKNQIVGLQIRKDDDLRVYIEEKGDYEAKCGWLSSKNREGGCAANAMVHYACDFRFNDNKEYEPVIPEGGVMLTEGIMKADITHFCQPNIPVISVPGVQALNYLEQELIWLKTKSVHTVLLAYDMDYETNPHVKQAMDKTKELIEKCGMKCKRIEWTSHISIDGKDVNINGIDDYLVFAKYNIYPQVKKK